MGVSAIDDSPIGLTGRVTGEVRPGTTGEVMISIRGGAETFYAHPFDGKEVIGLNEKMVVVDFSPPRTVYVTKL
jgi:hypothetical protein